jgi:hypothetical protein
LKESFTPIQASLTIGQLPPSPEPELDVLLELDPPLVLPPLVLPPLVLPPLVLPPLVLPPLVDPEVPLLVPLSSPLGGTTLPLLLLQAAATASAPRAVTFNRAIPLREAIRPSRRLMLLSPDSVACKAYASLLKSERRRAFPA